MTEVPRMVLSKAHLPLGPYRGPQSQVSPRGQRIWLDRLTLRDLTEIVRILRPGTVPPPPWTLGSQYSAVARVARDLAATGMAVGTHAPMHVPAEQTHVIRPGVVLVPDHSLPARERGLRDERWLAEWVMRLLIHHNPKRPGSASWDRWALVRDGMSIGDYRDVLRACGLEHQYCRGDVILAWEQGWIRLEEPDGTPVVDP